jgi:hypothetical protein
MKTYYVTIPIAGRLLFRVAADDKRSAKRAAWQLYGYSGEENAEDLEWEAYETIADGSGVCHVAHREIEVQEAENGS